MCLYVHDLIDEDLKSEQSTYPDQKGETYINALLHVNAYIFQG